MKIKWKILLTSISIIVLLTLSIVIITNGQVHSLVSSESSEELENYSSMGMQLLEQKYQGEWSIKEGKLYKGDNLVNGNYEVLDNFTKGTEVLATLFQEDTRVATNILDENKKRVVDTKASEEVINVVLKQGKAYKGTADILGKTAQTYYIPLKDSSGTVVGMWFVGIYTNIVNEQINSTMMVIVGVAAVLLVLGILVSYFLGDVISKGIKQIQDKLQLIEQGDFTFTFPEKLLGRKDEVGIIAASANNMQRNIANTIQGIQQEADKLKKIAAHTLGSMEEVHDNITDISASTEELSAGMQETSASTEEMNASTQEIETRIVEMKEHTVKGENLAKEIKKRAGVLKDETSVSRENAVNIYNKTNSQLRKSIEETQAIEDIKTLSQTILQITAQTNLLALNASIEAARAGEAGRGFSVVADEISTLAENSKQAVSQIDAIIENVSKAVNDVVDDSKTLLGFMDNQVLKDYGMLVDTSTQYDEDADRVHTIVSEVNHIAELLYENITQMRQAIEEVTTAASEGAEGTNDIAAMIGNITTKADDVLSYTKADQQSAEQLDKMVGFFKV